MAVRRTARLGTTLVARPPTTLGEPYDGQGFQSSNPTDLLGLLQPGMYDPNLDWQAQTENLGYLQNTGGLDVNQTRIHEGLFGGPGSYTDPVSGQRYDYSTTGSLGELDRGRDRTLGDLLTNRNRGQEDYTRSTGDLQRNYRQLGGRQSEATRSSGLGLGAMLQGARRRSENQGREQGVLDTNWRRFTENNDRDVARTNEDYQTGRGRLFQGGAYGQQDIDVNRSNAGATNTLFNQQVGQARIGSAQQMGTLPALPAPAAPGAPPRPRPDYRRQWENLARRLGVTP